MANDNQKNANQSNKGDMNRKPQPKKDQSGQGKVADKYTDVDDETGKGRTGTSADNEPKSYDPSTPQFPKNANEGE